MGELDLKFASTLEIMKERERQRKENDKKYKCYVLKYNGKRNSKALIYISWESSIEDCIEMYCPWTKKVHIVKNKEMKNFLEHHEQISVSDYRLRCNINNLQDLMNGVEW